VGDDDGDLAIFDQAEIFGDGFELENEGECFVAAL
jgi:hypothetical protein